MRVLHILNELRPSGAETMLRAAAGYWQGEGISGEILCTGETTGAYAASLQKAGYAVHHLPFAPSMEFLFALHGFLRKHEFGAVHIHTERGNFWYAALAYLTGRRKMVRSLHGCFTFTGGLRARRYAQRLIMRRIFAVRMAATSESVRAVEQRLFHNPALVIPNWFDSNHYAPADPNERATARRALGIEPKTFVVSSIGNCSPVKNHAAVLRAIGGLRREMDVIYLHAGEERDGCRERALAAELGIAGRVRFLGPARDARAVLNASDLFVMPSLREAFGVAAVEAMGAGVPVALAEVEGLRDFRGVSAAIHWMEPTAAAVKDAIVHFEGLPAAERRALGEQLSTCAHQRFGIAVGAAQYAALYRGEAGTPVGSRVAASC